MLSIADAVDLIEPVARFTILLRNNPAVGNIFTTGLEYWQPIPDVIYDLIWVQWCATYLNDEALVQFLERCSEVLEPAQGVIVLKENLSSSNQDYSEQYDGSVTRYIPMLRLHMHLS